MHFVEALAQRLRVGFLQRQFGLADQPGQRRAQLVCGVVEKALFLAQAAPQGGQQVVDRQHQGMHLARCLGHFDGGERCRRAVCQLGFQALQRRQAAPDAGIHQQAQQQAQQQQRHQHVAHQFTGNALLHRQAFGDLHAHGLLRVAFAKTQVDSRQTHRLALQREVVEHGLVFGDGQSLGRAGQARVAEQEAARGRGHHVKHAVAGVLFDDVLGRLREIHQQTRAHRDHLTRQRAHRLGERLVDGFFREGEGGAVGQYAARRPQHQLRQQQPKQQLAPQRKAVGGAHSRSISSR